MESIKGFFGEYRWLSNFHLVNIHYDGITYPSTENAYQATKTLVRSERFEFKNIRPNQAKNLGRTITLRKDWDSIKDRVMYDVSQLKYEDLELRNRLLATGDAYLEETNTWKDIYWGVCNGVGQNRLGKILMKIRGELNAI